MPDSVRPLLLEWVKYGKPNGTRVTAISLLPQVARGAEREITGRLIELLEDPWIFSRESAIEALGAMKAPEALNALQRRAQIEVDPGLRKAAQESIARIRQN
jgi:HEAT repeat protein